MAKTLERIVGIVKLIPIIMHLFLARGQGFYPI